MEPQDHNRARQIETLFHRAVSLSREQRAALLDSACAGDDCLRQELENLLQADATAQSFPESPVVQLLPSDEALLMDSSSDLVAAIIADVLQDTPATADDMDEASTILTPGVKIGYFLVQALLARGGMSEVYRAVDTRFRAREGSNLERLVTLKVIRPEYADRFELETAVLGGLRHPRICGLYDVVHDNQVAYAVLEYVEGQSLHARLRSGPLGVEEGVRFALQIAETLSYIHNHGVLHHDLKPANIMLTDYGAKLLDFGVARVVASAVSGERSLRRGPVPGTPAYISPEQVNRGVVDERSDIFSVGAILYEMFSGVSPFRAASDVATLQAVIQARPTSITELRHDFPRELDRLILRCLRKDPQDRFPNMRELRCALMAVNLSGTTEFAGRWEAELDYRWEKPCREIFDLIIDGDEVTGTASYGGLARNVLKGKIAGDRISFMTKSYISRTTGYPDNEREKTYEIKHYYKGKLSGDTIAFRLQSDGVDSCPAVVFTARRATP